MACERNIVSPNGRLGVVVTEGHLGGYLTGGDPATQFPALWNWLVDVKGVRSVIDIGCGDGQAVRHFNGRGYFMATGVDGVPQPELSEFILHDYTTGPLALFPTSGRPFDLCWSCEFVEHVEEQYVSNFLTTFRCANLLLMTHATPGQPGYHHVNCQSREYWIERMQSIGFELDEQLTVRCRILAAKTDHDWNQFVRSGLAFVKQRTPDMSGVI